MRYDVCLSFAGEDRAYVELVYSALCDSGLSVFYDQAAQAELWGQDLSVALASIYRKDSRFCIVFVSKHYVRKAWTNHERQHVIARQLEESYSYLLPAKLDESELPGLSPTVAYVNCSKLTPKQLSDLMVQKVAATIQLPVDELFLRLAKGEYLSVAKQLSALLTEPAGRLTPRDKNFALYNLACAQSRAAQFSATSESARNRLLNDSLASLREWLDYVDRARLRSVQDAIEYVQADDDLLFLRQRRAARLKRYLGHVSDKPTGSTGGCVALPTLVSTPLNSVQAGDVYRGLEIWSVDPIAASPYRRTRALVVETMKSPRQALISLNEKLMCTPAQRVFSVEAGWLRVDALSAGANIIGERGITIAVTSLREVPQLATVLALHTDHRTHNFFANGFLCHNIKP